MSESYGQQFRIFPSSFDPDDPALDALRIESAPWDSCARALAGFGAHAVLLHVPYFWQIMTPLHHVCTELGIPFYPNEPENAPVGVASCARADIDAVIVESRTAEALATAFRDRGVPLPAFLVIHRAEDAWIVPDILRLHAARIAQEVHLAPGVPCLMQCDSLRSIEPIFHAAPPFAYDEGERKLVCAARSPLAALALPHVRARAATCACGQVILESTTV